MSIKRAIRFDGFYIGDGVATSFTIDVKQFPVNPNSDEYINFSKTPLPVGVSNNGNPAFTVTISGTVLTITFPTAPANSIGSYSVYLLF